MFRVLECIFTEHDLRLVALAAIICGLSTTVAFALDARRARANHARKFGWTLLTGALAGAGVWATHFIAMMAYSAGAPVQYHVSGTVISMLVGAAGMAAGFGFSWMWKHRLAVPIGGAVAGLGVVGMHYLGVHAVEAAIRPAWDMPYVAASVVLAMTLGAAAFEAQRRWEGLSGRIAAPVLLLLAIVSLHFTAMAAVTLTPDLTAARSVELLPPAGLAVMIGIVVLAIFGVAFALMGMERHSRKSSLKGLETIFQEIPAGLALFDAEDRLVVWNPTFEAMRAPFGVRLRAGMPRSEILEAVARAFKDPADARAAIASLRGVSGARSDEIMMPDGRWVEVNFKSLASGDKIVILHDVTALKSSAVEMARARDRAEAANTAKSEFLANMSHEIRTPLNGVLGMVQVMDSEPLSPPQRQRLQVIKQSGEGLLAILNDVLDSAKIEAGRLEITEEDFDLAALSRATVALFEGAATTKGLTLRCDIEPSCAGLWRGDALRVRQTLSNLLGNAVKFTERGAIRLTVDPAPGGVTLAVHDTGIGIEKGEIAGLFEKFAQADATDTRQYGGTGLGLSISKELVELMGGRIEVDSHKGEGSIFSVFLPIAKARGEAVTEAQESLEETVHPSSRLRILAAEDNLTNQVVLRSMLAPIDADVTIVSDGAEAVAAFGRERFDVILMDIQMPVMNGSDAAAAIRAQEVSENRPRTPIIALTANVMSHQVESYRAAGIDAAIAKPIEIGKLYAALEAAANGRDDSVSAAA